MTTILLIIQILVAIALVAVVLMQRSEGGALGIGGGPGGMMTGRSAASLLTRTTMILGGVFMANSIALAALSTIDRSSQSVIERLATDGDSSPLPFSFDDEEVTETPAEAVGPAAGEAPAQDVPDAFEADEETAEPESAQAPASEDEPGR